MEKPKKLRLWYWGLHEAHPIDWKAMPDTRMPRKEAMQISEINKTMVFLLCEGMVAAEAVKIIAASKAR